MQTAEEHARKAQAIYDQALPKDDMRLARPYVSLAIAQFMRRHFEDALASHEKALEIQTRLLGPEHLAAATQAGNVAETLIELDRIEPALPLIDRLERAVEQYAKEQPMRRFFPLKLRGLVALHRRRTQDAIQLLERARAMVLDQPGRIVDQVREATRGGFYRVLGNIRRLRES